MRASTH